MMRGLLTAAIVLSAPASIFAQSSASYTLDEHAFNAGGRPAQAVVSSSPSFRLTLDSIGEPIAGRALSGASLQVEAGFSPGYAPPGEVGGLQFLADRQALTWSWERASTSFNVYAGPLSSLPGAYGDCAASRVAGTSWVDSSTPAAGSGVFYLVTGANRIREEGTKGSASTGVVRANPAPCP